MNGRLAVKLGEAVDVMAARQVGSFRDSYQSTYCHMHQWPNPNRHDHGGK